MSDKTQSDTESKPSPTNFYRVPEEVIKAWERGEYFTGNVPSLAYSYLGIALGLRGLYTYSGTTNSGKTNDFKGVAKIDLKGQDLVMEGVRLWDRNDKPDIKFWKTEFSHFLSDDKIIWTYRIFGNTTPDQLLSNIDCEELPRNVDNTDSGARFGFSQAVWQKLFEFLLNDGFTRRLRSIEESCTQDQMTRHMLHFDLSHGKDGSATLIKAKYRQLYEGISDENIAGDCRFERFQNVN